MKTPKEPKISVIIPCYNQGKYIDEAVDSVLNQTYQNFEIIIVDDGSTDNYTKGLLENFKKPKTKVYRTENKGASSARNYGFRKAKGEYIQFLDADDFLDRNKFEEQMQVFKEKGKIDICYTNYKYFIDENQQYLEPSLSVALSKNPLKDFLYRWQRDLSIPIHSAIFRKKVWGKALPFIQGFGVAEDWIMWTTLAKNGSKFFLI
jgi:glycosyltransferase involved in cell wall biosynthesis